MSNTLPECRLDSPYQQVQEEKEVALLAGLGALTAHHARHCDGYARILSALPFVRANFVSLADLPFLPVQLFKYYKLKSVEDHAVIRTLTSSGTSGQALSRIYLDAETSRLQVKALTAIAQDFIGRQRLPMLIIDQKVSSGADSSFSARAAGILGFSNFGHHHLHLLDGEMRVQWDKLDEFLNQYENDPVLIFGFTFIVWQHFLNQARASNRKIKFGESSILIHGGGWKKLAEQQVDNATFKQALIDQFEIKQVSNYYGMVEQVGSIFMECAHAQLHAPRFADVIMRDPVTLRPSSSGIVQVLSMLPHSYPGHSLLTEDIGTINGIDDCPCGRRGKYFHIHGRIPHAEMRGCSDVRSA